MPAPIGTRAPAALLALALFAATPSAPQSTSPSRPSPNRITLDVVVTPKSGAPVAGLQKRDFTILDNRVPRPIAAFQSIAGTHSPIEVVLVVDAVNINFINIAYEREQLDKFLHANSGHLAQPISLAFFTDTGTEVQEGPSSDGNAVSASLDKYALGLRDIRRSSIYGDLDRFQLSLTALESLVTKEAARPGRKIILWVSPGWPLLSRPTINLDARQSDYYFSQIVAMSTQLRNGNITLYSVDPLGAGQAVGWEFHYDEFLEGITKPGQVDLGDLALQVLAVQSGGLALSASNDIADLLERCMADTSAYYELSFDAPPADHRDEYHQLDIKMSEPGLTARTRTGYYDQP